MMNEEISQFNNHYEHRKLESRFVTLEYALQQAQQETEELLAENKKLRNENEIVNRSFQDWEITYRLFFISFRCIFSFSISFYVVTLLLFFFIL